MQFDQLLVAVYAVLAGLAAVFGLHRAWLLARFRWDERECLQPLAIEQLPLVTVQLPLYNERTVAARAIRAAGELDYPRAKLEIQVLDDSSDETREVVDFEVEQLRTRGIEAHVVRRAARTGFKAGALAHGLALARG